MSIPTYSNARCCADDPLGSAKATAVFVRRAALFVQLLTGLPPPQVSDVQGN